MNRILKILLLPSILLIPSAIYIFLQVFGVNEYSLPIYRTVDGLDVVSSSERPYMDGMMDNHGTFADVASVIDQSSLKGSISIVELLTSDVDPTRRNRQIQRIADLFEGEPSVRIIRIIEQDILGSNENDLRFFTGSENICIYASSYEEMVKYATKGLGINLDTQHHQAIDQLVLMDRQGRIRGYYTSTEFEEMDRLVLEIKILIKQDKNV